MKKIIYKNLDRFIEDTESYRQTLEVNLYWPLRLAIIFYRNAYPNLAIYDYRSGSGRFLSIRILWFEIELYGHRGGIWFETG